MLLLLQIAQGKGQMQRKHQQQSTYLFDPEEEEKKKPVKQAWNLQSSIFKLMFKILK